MTDSNLPRRPDQSPDAPGDRPDDRSGLRWLGFGIEFVGVLAIFTFGGYKADQYFKTGFWLTLVGFALGFVGMLYLLIKETADLRK